VLHHIFHLGLGQSAAYLNYNRDKTLGYCLFDQTLFYLLGNAATVGLCFMAAAMVKLHPSLARLGITTVGVALVMQILIPVVK
jgi:hypothetical protein